VRTPTDSLEPLEPIGDDLEPSAFDLPGTAWGSAVGANPAGLDRRSFEERYAELGFGLGVAPRRQRRDDAWWETPIGMLAVVGMSLALLVLRT